MLNLLQKSNRTLLKNITVFKATYKFTIIYIKAAPEKIIFPNSIIYGKFELY